MNVEENRLQTFQNWPENGIVSARQLAKEGFFATGYFLETECFCCHKRTINWEYGDCIRTRHVQLDPTCIFLRNPSESGNISIQQAENSNPIISTSTQRSEDVGSASTVASAPIDLTQMDLKIEANRLATFINWPNPNITPQALAKAGFYYLNRSDQVRCAWCKGVIAKWEKEDNAFEEHHRFFPDCPRVQLGPLIEIASEGIRDLGIQQISPPKRPKYASLDARLRTFTNWPISEIQRPEALAQAGLYFHNIDDQVRCFHCFIGLRSWQKEDDPWFEHARWYPQCQFVQLVKGPNYVQQVQEMLRQSDSQQQTIGGCEDLTSEQPTVTIEEAMSSSPVLQALEIGIDVGSIRTVTQRRLELTGRPYDTVENLLKAVFGDPDDNNEDDDDYSYNRPSESEGGAIATFLRSVANSVLMDDSISSIENLTASSVPRSSVSTAPTNSVLGNENDVPIGAVVAKDSSRIVQDRIKDKPKVQFTDKTKINGTSEKEVSPSNRNASLEEENRKLKDARLCKVCLDEEVGVVFLPCGHLVTCVQCAPGVNQCPMCRTAIKGFVRTFLS